ncbi:hypothetical protein BGP89_11330 [Luteimonas sp. JM171]|uniref:hypothetical protein n=1 Tax=Luteimonas sp. JM171 TaxID=1896164 RepID=UPI0012F8B3ED|nr:hypothetical protein [Luteimonas sp. JM171]
MLPTTPPCELTAGDSASWSPDLPQTPPPAWSVTYTLIGAEAVHSVSATADGDRHVVALSSEDTGGWAPGRYQVLGHASRGDDRTTFHRSELVVHPDPAQAAPTDPRSHARRVLDAIEAFLETGDQVAGQVQIADRRIAMIPIPDLLAMRDRYRAEVARESGQGVGGRVYTRLG